MAACRFPEDAGGLPSPSLARAASRLPFDDVLAPAAQSPLAQPIEVFGVRMGNRFCILPMEGWDGTAEGEPTDLTFRRWRNFGRSGAKLIWGGEAVAVREDGRANPNQLLIGEGTLSSLERLRSELVAEHKDRFGGQADRDLYVGLQLTHSGRFARPHAKDRPEPLTAYAHPVLDRRFPGGTRIITDAELDALVADFVTAARRARDLGYQFVDVKHCHGYLGHELLSARTREGRYGGSFLNRTRFLREIVAGIRAEAPGLGVGVRLSAIDMVPYRPGSNGVGVEDATEGYNSAFGLLRDEKMDLALEDSRALLKLLRELQVRLVCVTAGSPYYNPHFQRPALFPPTDGYLPPEDPLRGVARQIEATARLKAEFPDLVIVGSAYSYLQEWLPNVAQRWSGTAAPISWGSDAWSFPTLSCPPTSWPAPPCGARPSAAPSATAPPPRATAWSRAASPSIPSTRTARKPPASSR